MVFHSRSKSNLFVSVALVVIFAALWECAARGDVAATNPSETQHDQVEPGAKELLEKLANDGRLWLTLAKNDAMQHVEFVVTLKVPAKNGDVLTSTYFVSRDSERLALLVLSASGDPFAYVTNDLFACFSTAAPGRLILSTEGAPGVLVGANSTNGNLEIAFQFRRKANQPTFAVDLRSIIKTVEVKLRLAEYDKKNGTLHVATDNTDISLTLTEDNDATFPISAINVKSKSGIHINVSQLRSDPAHPELLTIDRAAIERLRLPMHILGEKEAPIMSLFVPPDFGTRPQEKLAAEKLRSLFPTLPKAEGPLPGTPPRQLIPRGRTGAKLERT